MDRASVLDSLASTNGNAEDEAQRLMELGSCVAGISHALRNLVFGISANLDALRIEPDKDAVIGEYLDRLDSETGRLAALMRDLTEYARPVISEPRRASLGAIAERAAATARTRCKKNGIGLLVHVPRELEAVVDERRVEEALRNLIANAINSTPPGGAVRVVGRLAGAHAELVIEDDGPGLDAEERECSLEPFYRRRKGGTGLEMPIARRNIEAERGTITFDNAPAGGARVTVLIPGEQVVKP